LRFSGDVPPIDGVPQVSSIPGVMHCADDHPSEVLRIEAREPFFDLAHSGRGGFAELIAQREAGVIEPERTIR
jgi:hypothetical protein